MNGRVRKIILAAGTVTALAGILCILYPYVSEWVNHGRYVRDAERFRQEVQVLDSGEPEQILESAEEYNAQLLVRNGGDIADLTEEERASYDSQLALSAASVMGYLEIPKIRQMLPVYHGTSEAVLQEGAGHLEGSSLPVGGAGTHCVLTGHSGLSTKKIFTDLDRLVAGDRFTISVPGRVLTYEVDSSETLLPEDVVLTITEGKDEATLITCTPPGSNTHRLLVHGHRVETAVQEEPVPETPEEPPVTSVRPAAVWFAAGSAAVCIVILLSAVYRRRRRR